jgi:hypothetical protein
LEGAAEGDFKTIRVSVDSRALSRMKRQNVRSLETELLAELR